MAGVRGAWCVVRRVAVVVACAACREVPAPEGGVHAISPLMLPSPGLVVGDTMRDSLGMAAPLEVIAFGLDNEPLDPQPERSFVVLDTANAHLADGRFLVGDKAGTTARVVGMVGALQTQPASVKVTLQPDTIVAADSLEHLVVYQLTPPPDTIAETTLNVDVRNVAARAGVEAVIVHFFIDQAPPSINDMPSVILLNGNVRSTRDTTTSNGRASRVARLRLAALSQHQTDTVRVSATTAYRGVSVGTVRFILVFQRVTPSVARITQ